jgi:hypothetical protein
LTKEQAHRIKLVLKAKQIEDVFVGHLSNVVGKEYYRFLMWLCLMIFGGSLI